MAAVTLKEKAYIELRKLILDGNLKPGEFLTERTLVEMLGMSRTPIRSALERLDVEGLAKYTPNKGLVVAEISLDRAIDFYDFRIAIECFVVKKLSERSWSEADLDWMRNNLKEQEECLKNNDFEAFTVADYAYHQKLAQVNENSEILQTMEQLQDKLYQIALKVLRKNRTRIQESYEDHVRIFNHIIHGEAEEAANEMEKHLEYGKRILIY
jgi:DNA-binding GntR family transcriptional regulator